MAPSTTKQWTIEGTDGFDSLVLHDSVPIPDLRDNEVLVQFHYASLNYRDLYPLGVDPHVVPGSDGAGTVVSIGSRVTRFGPGDKVITLFNQGHLAGTLTPAAFQTGLGAKIDGTLRQYGAFDENGLARMPESLTFQEASTLSCAALTAWNSLYGLAGHALTPGMTVLTQGTGGVSVFGVQFAKAAGARVIATTSSAEKAETLKKLGADHVINYKEDPNWGETAKSLTPNGEGVDHLIEVVGSTTLGQSLRAMKMGGVITIIGFVGGQTDKEPSIVECLIRQVIVRGTLVGSRQQLEDMGRAIDANAIKPVVDDKVFKLEDLKDAYQYMWDQKHVGKLTIKID